MKSLLVLEAFLLLIVPLALSQPENNECITTPFGCPNIKERSAVKPKDFCKASVVAEFKLTGKNGCHDNVKFVNVLNGTEHFVHFPWKVFDLQFVIDKECDEYAKLKDGGIFCLLTGKEGFSKDDVWVYYLVMTDTVTLIEGKCDFKMEDCKKLSGTQTEALSETQT